MYIVGWFDFDDGSMLYHKMKSWLLNLTGDLDDSLYRSSPKKMFLPQPTWSKHSLQLEARHVDEERPLCGASLRIF